MCSALCTTTTSNTFDFLCCFRISGGQRRPWIRTRPGAAFVRYHIISCLSHPFCTLILVSSAHLFLFGISLPSDVLYTVGGETCRTKCEQVCYVYVTITTRLFHSRVCVTCMVVEKHCVSLRIWCGSVMFKQIVCSDQVKSEHDMNMINAQIQLNLNMI